MLGRLIAETTGDELALVIALPYDPLLVGLEEYERALKEDSERLLQRARPRLDGVRFETLVYGGDSAPRLLHDLAERESASMVVLGSTHRGPLGRLVPGSVAERLLAGAPCAVAVAPRGYASREQRPIRSVGIGFDGSPESRDALALAAGIAAAAGSRLVLHAVVEPPGLASPDAAWMAISALGGEEWSADTERAAKLESALSTALEQLPDGVEGTGELVSGDPAQVLVERSAEADLLVLGSRGYGPFRRVLLGNVSGEVMHGAACPVVAVPRGAGA